MPRYLITYLGGNPPSAADGGQQHFAKYMEWLASLGDAAVSPANPIKDTRTVNPDGSIDDGGSSAMSGYTVIAAESMDAALALARACPFLEIDGRLEVSELVEMPNPM